MINIDNTNVRDNNNIGTNKEQYRHQQNNKTNNHTGEKQIIEEKKYRSKTFRHLRSIESRIKKDQHPKHQAMHKRTRTQHQKIRKQPATKKTRPPNIKKTPKIYFSHVPKYCSTNIETVDPSTFFSLFHEEITPLDDPT